MSGTAEAARFSSEHYRYEKLLGEGAYGRAILVSCRKQNTQWVVKEIDLGQLSPEERQHCLKEAKIMEALSHPNIIQFREIYQTKQQKLHIVMEYADGGTLADLISETARTRSMIDEERILSCFGQLALAVCHLHERKIVHRDIKPQNVFVTSNGTVKLGDFGVATVLERTQAKLNIRIGTPYYLSPEIVENKPYSLPSDIWSLGVVLYEMMALKKPFLGGSLETLALKIARGAYPDAPNNYGYGLRGILKKMLLVDPNSRPTIQKILKLRQLSSIVKDCPNHNIKQDTITHSMLLDKVGRDECEQQLDEEMPSPPTLLVGSKKISEQEKRERYSSQQALDNLDNIKTPYPRKGSIVKHKQPQKQCESNLQDLKGLLQIEAPLANKLYPKAQLPRLNQPPSKCNNIFRAVEEFANVDFTNSIREPAEMPIQDNAPKDGAVRIIPRQRILSKERLGVPVKAMALNARPFVQKHIKNNTKDNCRAIAVVEQKLVVHNEAAAANTKAATHKIKVKPAKSKSKNCKRRASSDNQAFKLLKQCSSTEALLLPTQHTLKPQSIQEEICESLGIKVDEEDCPPANTDCSFEEVPIEESIVMRGTLKLQRTDSSVVQSIRVDFAEMEKLKIAFQQLFGVETFVRLYKRLEELHADCDSPREQRTIDDLVRTCPEVNRNLLSQHYGMLVTLLSCEQLC